MGPDPAGTPTKGKHMTGAVDMPDADHPGPFQTLKVVLADDHQLFRDGVRVLLEEADVEIVADAGDAGAILAAVASTRPDILLLDIDLENSSGLDLIAPVRAISPDTKIIMLTADQNFATLQKCLAMNIDGYHLKSTTAHDLVQAMRRVMAGRLVLPQGIMPSPPTPKPPTYHHQPGQKELTPKEQEVLVLLRQGASNTEIAEALDVTPFTAKTHVQRIKRKLAVSKRIDFMKPHRAS